MRARAIVYTEHGPPDVLQLKEVEVPAPKEGEVLVRVRAASVNPLDWHLMRGEPYFLRLVGRGAKERFPGGDVAGLVEKVGADVTQFRRGDEVFGTGWGTLAEYVCAKEAKLVPKPGSLSFEQAAAIPVAACTAVMALRDHGKLQAGQSVLVNGASGGVGTFAVQIARALGAEVTGVCSKSNVDLVRSIGAHHVIDYTSEDFARQGRHYDLVLGVAGPRSVKDMRRVLTPRGRLVIVGGGTGREHSVGSGLTEVLILTVLGRLFPPLVRQRVSMVFATIRKHDLLFLKGLVEAGKLKSVIDRTYRLDDAAEAIRYLEVGHARGKVIVTP